MCLTSGGVLIRVPVRGIRQTGRSAQGVFVIRPAEGQTCVAVAKVVRPAEDPAPVNGQAVEGEAVEEVEGAEGE
jgi:DNA gyrase subunit A